MGRLAIFIGALSGLVACSSGGTGGSGGAGGASDGGTASGGGGAAATGGGGAANSEPQYDRVYGGRVLDLTVTFAATDWQTVEDNRQDNRALPPNQRDFIYVPVTVELDGERVEQAGFRYKGNSSFQVPTLKESFKVDVDEYLDQELLGFDKYNFNNGFKDPSMLRECLSLEMYRAAGAEAPRCSYARVYFDLGDGAGPQYWGLYTNVEQVDKTFLRDHFGADNDGGNLYKPDGPGADLSQFSETTFEKKTNETEADYSDVKALITLLPTLTTPSAIEAALEPIVDVDSVLRLMAINTILTSWDSCVGTGHNYYLYNNPKNGASSPYWEFIVWDANEAFGNFIPMGSSSAQMIDWPWDQPTAMAPKILFEKLMMVPAWSDQYAAYMAEFLADPAVFEATSMSARAAALHDLIDAAVHEDPNYLFSTSNPDLFTENLSADVTGNMGLVLGIQRYIADRGAYLTTALP
ncbi:MAG: CotH kinase family protein [Polyangiaceae bacterium]